MKKILTLIAALFSGSSSSAMAEKYEASMNFDLENVRPFLTELDSKFELELDVEMMVKFSKSIELEKGESTLIPINTDTGKSAMTFHVFMDDIDAPDLYLFFEQAEFAQKVGEFMVEWAELRGL